MMASQFVLQDYDLVMRRVEPGIPGPNGGLLPTLGLAAVARAGGIDGAALDEALKTGRPLPLPRLRGGVLEPAGAPAVTAGPGVTWPINYVGPEGSILTIPSDTLAALGEPGADPAANNPLRGAVVLLGGTFKAARDAYLTPHGLMPGVEVHANVAYMLSSRRFIRPSNWLVAFAINAGVVLVAGL